MATKKSVEKLFIYLNNPLVLDIINKYDNNRSEYIKGLLKKGPEDYYLKMESGSPDDVSKYFDEHNHLYNWIYLHRAKRLIHIVEYIILGKPFETNHEMLYLENIMSYPYD